MVVFFSDSQFPCLGFVPATGVGSRVRVFVAGSLQHKRELAIIEVAMENATSKNPTDQSKMCIGFCCFIPMPSTGLVNLPYMHEWLIFIR